jgi:hypothetical protein
MPWVNEEKHENFIVPKGENLKPEPRDYEVEVSRLDSEWIGDLFSFTQKDRFPKL